MRARRIAVEAFAVALALVAARVLCAPAHAWSGAVALWLGLRVLPSLLRSIVGRVPLQISEPVAPRRMLRPQHRAPRRGTHQEH